MTQPRKVHLYRGDPEHLPRPGAIAACGHVLVGQFHPATPQDVKCRTCLETQEDGHHHVG